MNFLILTFLIGMCSAGPVNSALPLKLINNSIDQLEEIAKSSLVKRVYSAGKLAGFYGVMNFTVSFTLTLFEHNDDNSEKLNTISDKIDIIDEKLNTVIKSYEKLEKVIKERTVLISLEAKSEKLSDIANEIEAIEDDFFNIIKNFASNQERFIQKLEMLYRNGMEKRLEKKLASLTKSNFIGMRSIVEVYRDIVRDQSKQNDPECRFMSSTMKSVYDLYILLAYEIFRINAVFEFVLNIKKSFGLETHQSDFDYVKNQRDKALSDLFASYKIELEKLDDTDLDNCATRKGFNKIVKFSKVLQVDFYHQTSIEEGHCNNDQCDSFNNRKYNQYGCEGILRLCNKVNEVYYIESGYDKESILDGFKYSQNTAWYGEPLNGRTPKYMKTTKACMVCRCICDQEDHPRSVRRFYIKKIEAPDGYVVTGVRFRVSETNAIFIQLQVGQLMPFLRINESTIHWQDFPLNTNAEDYFEYKFGTTLQMQLTKNLRNDHIVTGIRLIPFGTRVSLQVFSREVIELNRGILGREFLMMKNSNGQIINEFNSHANLSSTNETFIVNQDGAIKFGRSSEESDGGQSFVPFFDGHNIEFDSAAPISGIGIMHYTNNMQYGGYIRPTISSLNYKKIFKDTYNHLNSTIASFPSNTSNLNIF